MAYRLKTITETKVKNSLWLLLRPNYFRVLILGRHFRYTIESKWSYLFKTNQCYILDFSLIALSK